ncbi:MAG: hypothetical protein FGF53_05945 [Candidatus Brockarchaeota archaeon]|nr:hypothetical protein [Candidatus Brockarchaeota archaeon]MBO3808357.1 hypothetical protein [Candidatus Brockarchaeota archaeon]
MLTGRENAGGKVSQGKVSLSSRLLGLWPMLVLSILYLLSPVISGGETYNLVVAGILITGSLAGLMFDSRLRKIARYAFIVGVVIGIAGVSPPLYFAAVQGLVSPAELALSIACIILTVIAVLKRPLGLF